MPVLYRRVRVGAAFFALLCLPGLLGSACGAPPDNAMPTPVSGQLEVRRSGGFAGLDETLRVDLSDGSAVLTQGETQQEAQLTPEIVTRLREAVAQTDFERLPPADETEPPCCDSLTYRLSYQSYTVQTSDTTLPSELAPLITALNDAFADLAAR